jgi:hypothetical protein
VTATDGPDAGPAPALFVAVTVNVYAVPSVKPPTVAEVVKPSAVEMLAPPREATTWYDVIGLPPFEDGPVHDTVAAPSLATAETPDGAPGTVAGVTTADGVDAGPVPIAFAAVTVNV